MTKVIIYPQEHGSIAVVRPTGELPIEEVARKDVPTDVPYLIVDETALPQDDTFFNAWEADFSNPHGTAIGGNSWFIEQYNAEIDAINAEPMPARSPDAEQTQEEYDAIVAQWETSKAQRIEQLNKQIAVQEQEYTA